MVGEDQMSKRDRDALSDAIARMIDLNKAATSIAPDTIAAGAMKIIRFSYTLHNAGYYGCYQHMLQLARERLRGKYDPDARAQAYLAGQTELFSETLQDRYPRRPRRNLDGSWAEPEYVLRDNLSEADRWFNIDRLQHVSSAASKHCDALRAETVRLFGPRRGAA
jgi:hypothetical protein